MLTGFNHLTLTVTDLSRSLAFYSEVLNFRPRAVWSTGAYLSLGELWLCLSLDAKAAQRQDDSYTHYAFSIEQAEFHLFRKRLQENGVIEWQQNRSEGDSYYFLDPDGHRLEVHVGTLASRLAQCRLQPYAGMQFF